MPPASSQQIPDMSMSMQNMNPGIQSKPAVGGAWPGQNQMANQNPMANVSAVNTLNTGVSTSASMGAGPNAQNNMMGQAQPQNMGIPGPDQQSGNTLQNRNIIWKGIVNITDDKTHL